MICTSGDPFGYTVLLRNRAMAGADGSGVRCAAWWRDDRKAARGSSPIPRPSGPREHFQLHTAGSRPSWWSPGLPSK